MSAPDPRLNAVRPDLADAALEGRVAAERFVAGTAARIAVPSVPLRRSPRDDAPLDTELVFGEPVTLFDDAAGFAWVQSRVDRYVGYVPSSALARRIPPETEPTGPALVHDEAEATHRVHVPLALVFSEPSIKAPLAARLPMGARLTVTDETTSGDDRFHRTAQGFILTQHCLARNCPLDDWVALAEAFRGAPYLFGGKTWNGIDCSALVQLAVETAGGAAAIPAPRDSDMQEAELGAARHPKERSFARGDLLFWKGHVGIMVNETHLLHANGFHMLTAVEAVADALSRLAARGLDLTAVRHCPPDGAAG